MSEFPKRLAFIGGGNMAEAILAGLIHTQALHPNEIIVSEPRPERRQELTEVYKIEAVESNQDAIQQAQTLVLAIKPFKLDEAKEDLRAALTREHLVISILAGASREKLGQALGDKKRMVRVMPNLPALVGHGVSAITFPDEMGDDEREWVRTILRSVGAIVEVEEPMQDAVTAVSGSGPGYVFYLVHHFIEAAKAEGLDADTARQLAIHTFVGAAEVLKQGGDSPETLVKKVATPGGTTEAGLSVLDKNQTPKILIDVVHHAAERSRELNQG
ncbi:MAG: pyrroline-5-carboxylate reductase [Candidatus Hinthialibacter antarcticus]|nr:pyrroline-5-carboxylate reductase [Candidatus Hinthialibacter antarcticus]